MGKVFYNDVGLFRIESRLEVAIGKLEKFKKELKMMGISDKSNIYNTNLKEFIEFTNMLDMGTIIIQSALSRKESRGAHYRLDYINENSNFEKSTIFKNNTKEDIQ